MTSVFCVICRDNENTDWMALSCGHVCHQRCLTAWFNHNRSCPSCRRVPSGEHIKVYFESQEREVAAPLPAAAAAIGSEDPQEVQQLFDLLFNEAQEREAACKQALDSKKEISRLQMERQDILREAQRLEEELASCRNEMTRILQLLEQKEFEIDHLKQKLQHEEQQNRELNYALVAHEESSLLSNEGHASRQLKLEAELESEKQRGRRKDGVIEELTLLNSQTAEQKRVAEKMARDSSSKLNAVKRELEETITVLTTVKDDFERELTKERHERQQDAERLASLTRDKSLIVEQIRAEAEQNAVNFRLRVAELQAQNMKLEEKVREESNYHRELISEKQKNQQLMENYTKLKAAANEKVNKQNAAILKALEQQYTLENDNEKLRRLLSDKETEIAKLKLYIRNQEDIESADLTEIAGIYSEVGSAGIRIFNGGKQHQSTILKEKDNFADFPIFPVAAVEGIGMPIDPSVYRPAFASAANLNVNLQSSRQHDTTCILNSNRLQDAEERYLYDSPAALAPLEPPLKQPESVYYSHIGNSSDEHVGNRWAKLSIDTSCQNEAALEGNQISTDQRMAEERLHRDVGLRQQLGTGHIAPATPNPENNTSKRPLFASTSDLHVRHHMMPPRNMQLTTTTERAMSTSNLKSTDSSATVDPANQTRYQTSTLELEQDEEGGETASNVKSNRHKARKLGKEKSKKSGCKQM